VKRIYADADSGSAGAPAVSSGGGAGESLCAALVYHDKRVRYAAAIALANLNPSKPFANQEKVVDNLIDALGETGQRVVLVVERDLDLRNRIVGLLRESGYMVFSTESGNDGVNRAKSFPGEDLIIVSSELNRDGGGADPVDTEFIEHLRDDYRTKTIPCIILTPSSHAAEKQQLVDEKLAADVITPEIDRVGIDSKIKKIFEGEEYKRDEKARNDEISKRAALALAAVPQDHTVLQVERAGPALAGCLAPSRPDDVKVAAMKAIAAIGPKVRGACLDALTLVFKDKNNSVDVREAAAIAIGECVKGQAFSGDAFKALKAGCAEDEERIWSAASFALGKANLTGDQKLEVFGELRIE
jgi:CheY-like chemotaxis protein